MPRTTVWAHVLLPWFSDVDGLGPQWLKLRCSRHFACAAHWLMQLKQAVSKKMMADRVVAQMWSAKLLLKGVLSDVKNPNVARVELQLRELSRWQNACRTDIQSIFDTVTFAHRDNDLNTLQPPEEASGHSTAHFRFKLCGVDSLPGHRCRFLWDSKVSQGGHKMS